MPKVARRKDVCAATAGLMGYKPESGTEGAMELYDDDMSIWHVSSQRVAFFVSCIRRFDVSTGTKALGESYLQIPLRRIGTLLFQMALCLRFKGIVAYNGGTIASGIDNTSGTLDVASNGVQVQPYWCDYLGLAATIAQEFHMGSHKMLEMSNSAALVVEEFQGVFNHTAKKLLGKHSEDSVAPWDAAKFSHVSIVVCQFFFCRNSGAALAQSAIGYHGAECKFSLAEYSALIVIPSVTLAEAGASGSTALYGSSGFQVYLRADDDDAWGTVPTDLASSSNVLSDVYLLASIVTLPQEEADAMMTQVISQNITKYDTIKSTVHQATSPTADYDFKQKITVKRPIDAIYVFARQKGNKFAELDGGFYSYAPTKPIRLLKNLSVDVDGSTVYDCSADENPLEVLYHCSQNSDMPILVAAWSQDVGADIALGSLYADAAMEVEANITMSKDAWPSGVQDVEVFVVTQYKEPITMSFGMLSLTQ